MYCSSILRLVKLIISWVFAIHRILEEMETTVLFVVRKLMALNREEMKGQLRIFVTYTASRIFKPLGGSNGHLSNHTKSVAMCQ